MSGKLITIAEYADSISAQMAIQVLDDFGIKGIIIGQNAADVFGGVPALFATVKIQVLENDAEKAKEILEEQEQGREPEDYEVMDESEEVDEPYEPDEEEGK